MLIDLTVYGKRIIPDGYPGTLVIRVNDRPGAGTGVFSTSGSDFDEDAINRRQPVVAKQEFTGEAWVDFIIDCPLPEEVTALGVMYDFYAITWTGGDSGAPQSTYISMSCNQQGYWNVDIDGGDVSVFLPDYESGWVERNPDAIIEPARPRQIEQKSDR